MHFEVKAVSGPYYLFQLKANTSWKKAILRNSVPPRRFGLNKEEAAKRSQSCAVLKTTYVPFVDPSSNCEGLYFYLR